MSAILELTDITVSGLVERFNLRLEPGTITNVITKGDVESGLLTQTLIGNLQPETGSVLFKGRALEQLNREQLISIWQYIAVITVQAGLISNLKLWENITLPLLYHHSCISQTAAEKGLELLEQLDYKGNIWVLPGYLTPGERIVTAFVRAIMSEPHLLIFSECLDELNEKQRNVLSVRTALLKKQDHPPASVFINSRTFQFSSITPDVICDLRCNPPIIMRQT